MYRKFRDAGRIEKDTRKVHRIDTIVPGTVP